MSLDANDLILFAHIMEAGSFSRAAERTGLPKSTLSRRITALETKLGERLLTRSTRRLRPLGQVLQPEEHAFAGAPAHVGRGDLDLCNVGHQGSSGSDCLLRRFEKVLREALQHAALALREHPAFYQFVLADNGTGGVCDPEAGIGLKNIRERVESFRGVLTVTAKDGFRIFITISKEAAK